MTRIAAAWKDAQQNRRRIVFVTADAGAGKTTLVDAFLTEHLGDGPLLVARGQCVEYRGSGEPYMPLLDALARLAGLPARAESGCCASSEC